MKMKIHTRLVVWAALGVLAVVSVVSFAAYRIARSGLKEEVFSHLQSVAQARAHHVQTFLESQKSLISLTARDIGLVEGLRRLRDGAEDKATIVRDLNSELKGEIDPSQHLYEVLLLDHHGEVLASTNPDDIGLDKSADAYFVGANDGPYIKDAHHSETTGKGSIVLSAAVVDSASGELLGVVAARHDMVVLNEILTDRSGLGQTGETYLINKYGFMITPSRFLNDTFLKLKVDTEIARDCLADMAAMRREQLPVEREHPAIVFADYRGKSVLGVHNHVSEMQWGVLAEIDASEAFAPVARLRTALLLFAGLSAASAMGMSYFIARRISQPIHELHVGAERIGAGELNNRLDIRTGDEIEQLAHEFNRMAARLSESRASLERKVAERTADLTREIAERKQAEEELERLNAELNRSNRDLQDFTYTVSHDLQEPLRKIHAFGQFLVEDCGDHVPEEGREHLRHIQDAAVRMKDLIRHLLTLARVGTRGGEIEPAAAGQVIQEVLQDMSEQVRECGAAVSLPDRLPTVLADAVQLGQVFQNLIANALKFRSPDRRPEVAIGARVEGDQAVFSVTDNGIGIEERFLERIFGVFQRLHLREEYEGAGVGLALCKKIVLRHGGRIWAESELGKGSTFHFILRTVPQPEEKKP